ncbi:P-loop NTPase fold protein [Pectobacterium polaris]|uniref:P-loop NTPase fold protein n=1 Tax=Pectobacterium polaris TaxID=2042057 RepID=UPI001583D691|nr:P-loop NTPase fold protein [Pectobacterium polaris]
MEKSHLQQYLDHYKTLENPGFAVLINGDWGAGKTYQIKQALKEEEICYVSLFGLTTTAEIYSSIFFKMFPLKAKTKSLAEKLKEIEFSALGITISPGNILSDIAGAIIKEEVDTKKIIVLDDLERTNIPLDEILGVINKYIEHLECKLIAIVHDTKLQEAFDSKKEKIFGHSLRIEPDIKNTYETFIQKHPLINSKTNIKKHIFDIFTTSKCTSLRVLKYIIDDCMRLYECLDDKHLKHDEAMKELFYLFTSLCIFHRTNKLYGKDLINRNDKEIAHYVKLMSNKNDSKEHSEYKIIELEKTHKEKNIRINISSILLQDETLIDCIINGAFDPVKIKGDLNSHQYFLEPEEIKPWMGLMNFDKLDDDKTDQIIIKLDEAIKNREIIDIGDMLHSFHFEFLLSYSGCKIESYDDIKTSCIDYIDDLYKNNTLPLPDPNNWYIDTVNDNAHGYAFWTKEEYQNQINEIKVHLKKRMSQSLENKYDEYNNEVMNALSNDINTFTNLLTVTSDSVGRFANIGILSKMNPNEFIDTWLNIPRSDWLAVKDALYSRYNSGRLSANLSDEVNFIIKIKENLQQRANNEIGIKKLRIERLIPTIEVPESHTDEN